MAHRYTPQWAPKTEDPGPDDDSDRDSGVGGDAGEDDETYDTSSPENDRLDTDDDSTVVAEFTVFVAFKGNMDDEDFTQKLDCILSGIPDILDMDMERLQPQHVEPWNSVRVTFNIPREAAERLRLLAQNNQQQLRDLGILSVQIEGEGAINVVPGPNRGPEVRVNGPIGGPSQMRVDVGFSGQPGPGTTGIT
uniref:Nuclear receptor coactivator 6 TRADD-N domain-containing protein n=1 Tax=Neogobius melanostomus TaxID=47308 RepID=A0A8C6TBN0_9GOBI